MSSQKLSSIKIPAFNREHYNLWKKKMLLFIRASNPMYLDILKHGPFIPMIEITETTVGTEKIPKHYEPKDPFKCTDPEKEKVALDGNLQLIICESMDFNMYGTVAHCSSAKKMWDLIEVLCEGTPEVRKNKKQILVSQSEAFMAQPKEGITEVFERFNKLINELKLYDKHCKTEEINMKFLLTLPDHLEPRISSLKERDLTKIGFDVLYGVLKKI
ncbi:hypothetical protein POM88_016478 [Heracleum sosnowskyi]|uniref:Uncharacterized protein n=1 Tax=Heracleum sosnowskyi TaxID=360622 RepID=A0AAD8IQN8_9APIA|nr:hypothetical protein POM88_016478 [Heracleum sosnowskyi]